MLARRALIFIALLLLAACEASHPPLSMRGLPDTGQPVLHAVTDARLRQLMEQMESLMFDRFMTQPELDQERRKQALLMAESASRLGPAIDSTLAGGSAAKLDAGERNLFRALADKLQNQAKTLEWQARHNQFDALPATLDQMAATCSSCHALFRKRAP